MSTTTASGPIVEGRLAEQIDGKIVLTVPETSYRLHLVVEQALQAQVGERITGVIRCKAKRVDVVPSGGRFIEPVYGRPRRIQGVVSGGDVQANTLLVKAGAPVTVTLMPSQKAGDFKIGQMVCFDVERGASFERRDVE